MRKQHVLIALSAACALLRGADWPTDGGNPQRTAWQQDEKILNKNNVKNLKILWKIKLDNQPQEMHSLFPPLILEKVSTAAGVKQIAIEAGISDNLYAIDVETGTIIWKKHFEYPTPERRGRVGDPLCPPGQTATPVIGPANASGARTLYALAGDGQIHSINVANGEDVAPPFKFGYPNGKSYALNLWNNVIFTTTSQGCAGNPNQIWAVDITDPEHKVMTFHPKSGGLWGRTGAAIDSTGTAWAPTGDGHYDPEKQMYGNGLIGARVEGKELKLKDYYEPSNWVWLQKRDLDMQVTPAIFKFKDRELMITGSKECRVYLLDTRSAGGANHQTPLYRTPLLCNEEADFQSAGIWGSMASWLDSKGTRWALTPFWGPVHPDFKVPISYGDVKHGAVVAMKVEEQNGKFQLTPAWMSRDMDQAEPPVIANGVVYSYGNGENTRQAYADRGLADFSPLRIAASGHAVLYALDAETGKELYSSGDQIKSFNHFSGLSVANGRVYIATFDSVLYCFGLRGEVMFMNKILTVALVSAGLASPQGRPIDWPSYGGNAQRTGWEKSDIRITRDNVKDFQLVLKKKLDDKDLTPPSVIGLLISYRGFKELAMVAGSNDNVWAIDADLDKVLWHRHLDSASKSAGCGAATPALFPPLNFAARPRRPAVTATSVPPVPSARATGTANGSPRSVFALSSDGVLHQLNGANGTDQFPPLPFVPANAKASVLTVQDGIVYTTTSSSCGSAPNGVWAIDLNEADPKPASFVSKTGAISGLGGFAIGADGTVYVQTADSLVALNPKDLKPKQSFTAPGGAATPVVFTWKKKELVAAPGKDGRLYLLDAEWLNSAPLAQTEPGPAIQRGFSSWEDDDGTRWVAAPAGGSIVAYKLEEKDGKPALIKAWTSREMNNPQPPVVTSGVVFVVAAGPPHATLYALDAATGKEMYSTGNQVTAPANLTGVTLANGRVYFTTTDKTLYAFGIFLER